MEQEEINREGRKKKAGRQKRREEGRKEGRKEGWKEGREDRKVGGARKRRGKANGEKESRLLLTMTPAK